MIAGAFHIIGSLGLFLYGMKVMSDGIQKAAGERLHSILNLMTVNRFTAVFTGFFITALIQSSSATTVMVVSFVNAGLLNLVQAIGVIMGANIGTTVTGWIVAIIGFKVKISHIALPAVGIGLPLLLSKKMGKQDWGEAIIGFGLLFLGLSFLKNAVPDIKNNPEVLQFVSGLTGYGAGSFFIFVLIGTFLTVIVQSSSAAMAITLTMANAGWIDFPTAAAIILGENIGTTVTAFLASVGTGTTARRASRAHTLFNLFGVLWMAFLFHPFLNLVNAMVPGDIFNSGSTSLIPAHLAMFHTLFNVINTLVFMSFTRTFAKIVEKIVPEKEHEKNEKYILKYFSTGIQGTAELNILKAKTEINKMAEIISGMFQSFRKMVEDPGANNTKLLEEIREKEDYTDQMQEQITIFLAECASQGLNEQSTRNITAMIRIVEEMESIADSIYNLAVLSKRKNEKNIRFVEAAEKSYLPYVSLVNDFLSFISAHTGAPMVKTELESALLFERKIDAMRDKEKEAAQHRMQKGSDVRSELLFVDFIKHLEHIGDHCLNIAQALRSVNSPFAAEGV